MQPQVQSQGSLQYIGQPDYRGYLSAQSQQGYGGLQPLLNSVGNNGQLDPTKTNPQLQAQNQSMYQTYLNLLGKNQPAGAGAPTIPGPYIPPQPATINVGGILANAKQGATNSVNPLYDQYLNQYLQNEAAGKTAQESQNQTAVENLQAQLANELKSTELDRSATQQNTALDLANIQSQEQNYQAQSGLGFDQQRAQQLSSAGQSGLAGTGLAQGADAVNQQGRNLKEAGQEQQYNYSTQQKQLLENQTMGQLSNSDALNKLKETEGENTANFNLADYLRQAGNDEFQFQKQNETERQNAIQQATSQLYKTGFLGALQPYAGTPTYGATYSAYGGGSV